MSKKILFIVTSHDQLGNTGKPTGYYLPELAHPFVELSKHYDLTIATPKGGKAPLDPSSKEAFQNDEVCKEFLSKPEFVQAAENTKTLSSVAPLADTFAAVVFPGGHGPLWDLVDNSESHAIVRAVWEKGGVVAAVCHGPAALTEVKLSNGKLLVEGKNVTGFSEVEEDAVQLTQVVPFVPETRLKERGAKYTKAAEPWGECVVVDGKLVTGQNPASSGTFGKKIHELLSH